MRCSECSHMSEYAALLALLFLALYSPQRITQNLPRSQIDSSKTAPILPHQHIQGQTRSVQGTQLGVDQIQRGAQQNSFF